MPSRILLITLGACSVACHAGESTQPTTLPAEPAAEKIAEQRLSDQWTLQITSRPVWVDPNPREGVRPYPVEHKRYSFILVNPSGKPTEISTSDIRVLFERNSVFNRFTLLGAALVDDDLLIVAYKLGSPWGDSLARVCRINDRGGPAPPPVTHFLFADQDWPRVRAQHVSITGSAAKGTLRVTVQGIKPGPLPATVPGWRKPDQPMVNADLAKFTFRLHNNQYDWVSLTPTTAPTTAPVGEGSKSPP